MFAENVVKMSLVFLIQIIKHIKNGQMKKNEILYKYYKDFTGEELQSIFLPHRSIRSIECHAGVLGLQGKIYEESNRNVIAKELNCSEKLKGRLMSEETKGKISATKKEYFKTHNGWWKGKKRSQEQRQQMSERRKGEWDGENNPRHKHPLIGAENGRWKGGILPTYLELRSDTKDWFNDSLEFCNYKCIITGGEFDNVHHTTAFRQIVDETFELTGVKVKEKVCDYSEEEFTLVREKLKELHKVYGYGACMHKYVHKLFHDNYGYTKFSPFDFLDFVYRIDVGEFDDWFRENNLEINLNYNYIEYLESTLAALAESA